MDRKKEIETFLAKEIESTIREINDKNREKKLKNIKKHITESEEELKSIKEYLMKYPEFGNTTEIAESYDLEKLKELEKKWMAKINKSNSRWKVTKLPERLLGFLSSSNKTVWSEECVDRFIDSIRE